MTVEHGQSLRRVFDIFRPDRDVSTARQVRAALGWIYDFVAGDVYSGAVPGLVAPRVARHEGPAVSSHEHGADDGKVPVHHLKKEGKPMAITETLNLNAYLKMVEFVLHSIDESNDEKNIGEIRREFHAKFDVDMDVMLNQNFGLLRLVPLMHMAEKNFLEGTEDGRAIKAIRNAFAHNTFSCDQNGYTFNANRDDGLSVTITYAEFVPFIYRVENAFYASETYRAARARE